MTIAQIAAKDYKEGNFFPELYTGAAQAEYIAAWRAAKAK